MGDVLVSNFAALVGSALGSSCLCISLGSAHMGIALLGLRSAKWACAVQDVGTWIKCPFPRVNLGMACLVQRMFASGEVPYWA